MSKPVALLLGTLDHAKAKWDELASVAELKELNSGSREQFISDLDAGVYNDVVAILHTYPSQNFTGLFDKELIDHFPPSLKFIAHHGAGYDQIDVDACTAKGILVANTPTAVDNATANVALQLMLGALRRAYIPETELRKGKFRGATPLGHDPEGKTIGILGMGGIGEAFAKRCSCFDDVRIIYHNRNRKPDSEARIGAKYVSLDELLAESDIISVHLPLNKNTRHFLGPAEFAKMKDGAIIVNTARGAVIDESAMFEALNSGKLFSVGLDVFEKEPEIHPGLIEHPNAYLLPHIGTATYETQYNMDALVVSNIESALKNGKLLTVVPEQK
ncbi:hypothetical protein CANCADRAFT_72592 [Tortispora caseinolytica NRRL Y-17796]|uniref:Glyoxylate reductase n=1 Tax=Tortispora caseinolytica NRRL Y-17796 TaxID=767744 RepID=A0A1E4TIG9_9ASCO|nr:hypothetical protein CANCADRAFT_72592 [Tortispora caseinolytica NRRL Y-17796]